MKKILVLALACICLSGCSNNADKEKIKQLESELEVYKTGSNVDSSEISDWKTKARKTDLYIVDLEAALDEANTKLVELGEAAVEKPNRDDY